MKIRTVILVAFVCFVSHLCGQVLTYQWTASVPYEMSPGVAGGTPDAEGNFYLLGNYLEASCFSNIAAVSKINSVGGIIWTTEYLNDTGCQDERLYDIHYFDSSLIVHGSAAEGWIMRLDSDGSSVWERDSMYLYYLGHVDALGNSTVINAPTPIVVNYDITGALNWQVGIQHTFPITPMSLEEDESGRKYIFYSYSDNTQLEVAGVGLTILSSGGGLLSDTTINYMTSTDPDYAIDMAVNEYGDAFMLSRDANGNAVCLNKYDFIQGTLSQALYLPLAQCAVRSIEIDTLHDLVYTYIRIASGYTILKYDYFLNPLDTISINDGLGSLNLLAINTPGFIIHTYQPLSSDSLIVDVFDWNGALVERYYHRDTILNLNPKYIYFDNAGGLYIVCNGDDANNDDFGVVIKFDQTTGTEEPEESGVVCNLFPNPATDALTISLKNNTSRAQLNLCNASGQLIHTCSFSGESFVLNTGPFSTGLYFIEVTTESGQRLTQKLIIHHP